MQLAVEISDTSSVRHGRMGVLQISPSGIVVGGWWVVEWLEALRVASVELYRPRTTDVQQQERLV